MQAEIFKKIREISAGRGANEVYPFLQRKLADRWIEKYKDRTFDALLLKDIEDDVEVFLEEMQGNYEFDESFMRSMIYNKIIPKLKQMVH